MKKLVLLLSIVTFSFQAARADFGVTPAGVTPAGQATTVTEKAVNENNLQGIVDSKMSTEDFLKLTPKKVKKNLGRSLKIKEVLALKAAQKAVKKEVNTQNGNDADISKGIYILLAFLGWAWLVMGLMDDWSGSDWVVNLILTILCWLPGFIHALVKMKKYYS